LDIPLVEQYSPERRKNM